MQRQIAEQKEATRRAEERALEAQRQAEADRRETLLREMIAKQGETAQRIADGTQRQIEAIQAQFREAISNMTAQMANSANRQDPLITLMIEQARQQSEAVKEMARENRAALERVHSSVMNPRELMALARESAEGADKAVERTTRLTNEVIAMQNRVLETAIATQPGGPGIVDAVTQGMNNVKEFLERFFGGKSKEVIAQAQAQAKMAQAQVAAMEIQARAMNPAAFPLPAAPADQAASGLGDAAPASAATAPANANDAQPAATREPERLWGRTDSEWFGVALGDVMRLRIDVEEWTKAAQAAHASGQHPESLDALPGTSPQRAVGGLLAAVAQAQQMGVTIPALTELLTAGHLQEFTQLLLPDAIAEYRAEVIKLLQEAMQEDDDEDGKEGDDDDDDGEDAASVAPVAAPPAKGRGKNGARARA
jgi:hypothetical protein